MSHPRIPLVFFAIVPLLLSGLVFSLWWIVLGFLSLFQSPKRKPRVPLHALNRRVPLGEGNGRKESRAENHAPRILERGEPRSESASLL